MESDPCEFVQTKRAQTKNYIIQMWLQESHSLRGNPKLWCIALTPRPQPITHFTSYNPKTQKASISNRNLTVYKYCYLFFETLELFCG